jgi:hypothetical protein
LSEGEASDARDARNRDEVLHKVRHEVERLRAVALDGQAWRDVLEAILDRKKTLIGEVLKARTVLQTSWIPWRKR